MHNFKSLEQNINSCWGFDWNCHSKVLRGLNVCIEFYGKLIGTLFPILKRTELWCLLPRRPNPRGRAEKEPDPLHITIIIWKLEVVRTCTAHTDDDRVETPSWKYNKILNWSSIYNIDFKMKYVFHRKVTLFWLWKWTLVLLGIALT